ncbi:hypothetical protein [Amycolatopsis methanolica]|uniref:hypothetical protein n=1 Tax=Amycolatopsis methanolica TaxID=1814 RepID=UPI00036D88DA|nr:hypothetical protein [Amycolatopsis methanolica]
MRGVTRVGYPITGAATPRAARRAGRAGSGQRIRCSVAACAASVICVLAEAPGPLTCAAAVE